MYLLLNEQILLSTILLHKFLVCQLPAQPTLTRIRLILTVSPCQKYKIKQNQTKVRNHRVIRANDINMDFYLFIFLTGMVGKMKRKVKSLKCALFKLS